MSKSTQNANALRQEKLQKAQELTNPARISKTEKKQLQSVFGMDTPIYTALRDCFYGFEITDGQRVELGRITPVMYLMRRVFLPQLSKDLPFGQNYDLWQTQDIKNSDPDSYPYFYEAKLKILEWLEKSLKRLENPDLEGVNLEVKDNDFSFVVARNGYVSYVDSQIRFLMQYAIQNTLSEQEIRQILQMNSTK